VVQSEADRLTEYLKELRRSTYPQVERLVHDTQELARYSTSSALAVCCLQCARHAHHVMFSLEDKSVASRSYSSDLCIAATSAQHMTDDDTWYEQREG
jgi:hypothetical protein